MSEGANFRPKSSAQNKLKTKKRLQKTASSSHSTRIKVSNNTPNLKHCRYIAQERLHCSIGVNDCSIRVSDCSIRVSRFCATYKTWLKSWGGRGDHGPLAPPPMQYNMHSLNW